MTHMNEPGSRQLIRMANDRVWEEGYAVGVSDAILRATQYERILTDLIAELRTAHHAQPYTLTEGHYCPVCQTRASRLSDKPVDWPCDTARMADRAESRLKGLTDE